MDLAQFTAQYGANPVVYKMDKKTNQIVETIPLSFNTPAAAFEFVRGLEVQAFDSFRPDSFYFTHDPTNRSLLASPLTLVSAEDPYGYDQISSADYEQMTESQRAKIFRFVMPTRGFSRYINYHRKIQAWLKEYNLPHKFVMVYYGYFGYNEDTKLVPKYQIRKIEQNPADPMPIRANFTELGDYLDARNSWLKRHPEIKTPWEENSQVAWFFTDNSFLNGLLANVNNVGESKEPIYRRMSTTVYDKDSDYQLN